MMTTGEKFCSDDSDTDKDKALHDYNSINNGSSNISRVAIAVSSATTVAVKVALTTANAATLLLVLGF